MSLRLLHQLAQLGVELRFVVAIIIAMTTVLIPVPALDVSPDLRLFLFVFALLPLLNAIFDYLSYGTTLTLLHKGQDGPSPRVALWALLDVVAAFAYIIALGLTLTAVVHLINTVSGVPMIDLSRVFADLRDPARQGDYLWLILACLTTLIPTLFHIALAGLAATAWVGPGDWLKTRIEDEGQISTLLATATAAACTVGAIVVFGVVLSGIAMLGLSLFSDSAPFGIDTIALLVLDCVGGLAHLIGAR